MSTRQQRDFYYRRMSHAVEVKWPSNVYYEPIACFDCEEAASHYARECFERSVHATEGLGFSYRVTDLKTLRVILDLKR